MKIKIAAVALILMTAPCLADSYGSVTGGTRGTLSDLVGCTYNSSAPTLTTGQQVASQCDSSGNIKTSSQLVVGASAVSSANPVPVSPPASGSLQVNAQPVSYIATAALAANSVVKASAGSLMEFQVSADSTLSGADWWVMAYDATSAPADGAVTPQLCYRVASGGALLHIELTSPITFSTGIVIGVSTTGCFTKTASTHAFISAGYK